MKQQKRLLEYGGIIIVAFIIIIIIFLSYRSASLENSDREILEDVRSIRIALQEYFYEKGNFPPGAKITLGSDAELLCADQNKAFKTTHNECPLDKNQQSSLLLDFTTLNSLLDNQVIYKSLPKGCVTNCEDYELIFTLLYGSDFFDKGKYSANKTNITLIKE